MFRFVFSPILAHAAARTYIIFYTTIIGAGSASNFPFPPPAGFSITTNNAYPYGAFVWSFLPVNTLSGLESTAWDSNAQYDAVFWLNFLVRTSAMDVLRHDP